MHHIKPMKLFSSIVTCAVFGSTMAVSALPESKSNPINPNLPDCMTGLRNGFLVNQETGQPMMTARCQDYEDGQYWTVGEYVRSR